VSDYLEAKIYYW